jgi:hypothetical protein
VHFVDTIDENDRHEIVVLVVTVARLEETLEGILVEIVKGGKLAEHDLSVQRFEVGHGGHVESQLVRLLHEQLVEIDCTPTFLVEFIQRTQNEGFADTGGPRKIRDARLDLVFGVLDQIVHVKDEIAIRVFVIFEQAVLFIGVSLLSRRVEIDVKRELFPFELA